MGKTIVVTGDRGAYEIGKSGKTWIFDKDCHIDSDRTGIFVSREVTSATIILQGISQASYDDNYAAITAVAGAVSITIAKGAKALGPFGAITDGAHSEIDNFGVASALRVSADHSGIVNSGLITSSFNPGMAAWEADDCTLVNEKDGRINVSLQDYPYASAMKLNTLAGQSGLEINHGMIKSGAVSGGLGKDTFINDGTLNGDVLMLDDNDKVDNRGGTINGTIGLGDGNDTLITDKATDLLAENADQGLDTVRSTVTYTLNANVEKLVLIGAKDIDGNGTDDASAANFLFGNAGDNALIGFGGHDELFGGKGSDMLVGGTGNDNFGLGKGYGKDVVKDFDALQGDLVDLHLFKDMKSFEDVQSHIKKHGADTWIDMDNSDVLVLRQTSPGELSDASFVYAM